MYSRDSVESVPKNLTAIPQRRSDPLQSTGTYFVRVAGEREGISNHVKKQVHTEITDTGVDKETK
jgi:hypothetical protein